MRVVRYMKETIKMGLTFGLKTTEQLLKDLLPYRLINYIDSDFARDLED